MGSNCCQEPIKVESELDDLMPIEVKLLKSGDASISKISINSAAHIMQEQLDPHARRIICEKSSDQSS